MSAPMASAWICQMYRFQPCFQVLRKLQVNRTHYGTVSLCRQCSSSAAPWYTSQTSNEPRERQRESRDFRPRQSRDFRSRDLRSRDFPSRNFGARGLEDFEEELEFDVSDEEMDDLRRQHRDHTRSQTMVDHGKKFADFPISEWLRTRLDSLGYHEPFSIQADTLEHTLNGRDVIGRAFTGSGKTLAFSIPIVERIMRNEKRQPHRNPRAIVISPTRELCLQIYRSVQELNPSIRCLPVYGGESLLKQQRSIQREGVDIVCATPGRLKDHQERGSLRLDDVEFVCLDEADHLLAPDFLIQIENVLRNSPRDKQVMLFSATMPPDIKNITRRYMSDAVFVDQSTEQNAPASVKHLCMEVPRTYHVETVQELLKEHQPERCIIFIKTKALTKVMASRLRRAGLNASELHSDLSQAKRTNIMGAFRTGKVSVLVATDVAARGLDVPEVDLVIQVEPPANGTDFYIHRSGRTGRAGREGLAVMIHCGSEDERKVVHEIERIVPLQHTQPPNYTKLQHNKMYKALKVLQEMPEATLAPALPLVEKVELGEERRLLAAAMMLLKDSEVLGSRRREETGGFRAHAPPRKPRMPTRDRFRFSSRHDDDGYHGNDHYGNRNRSYQDRSRGIFDEE